MNKFKKLITLFQLCILILWSSNCSAQWTGDEDGPYAQINLPGVPSPNAASLGSYANFPNSDFSGSPSINIPIYEINEGGFKLPISLSYRASGVKVNDIASWVGLNWTLNAGGVITRNMRDYPDDDSALGITPQPIGFLYSNYNVKLATANANTPSYPSNMVAYNDSASNQFNLVGVNLLTNGLFDTEPDIFYYNFNGNTGKFFFSQGIDNNNYGGVASPFHKILMTPYNDIKFTYTIDNTLGKISSFTAIDKDGNNFLFNNKEQTTTSSEGENLPFTGSSGLFMSFLDPYNSSWYLTKITTVDGKIINYNYTNEYYTEALPTVFSVVGLYNNNFNCSSTISYSNNSVVFHSNTSTSNSISGQRLSSITGDDFEVDFIPETNSRSDLFGSHALSKITVYSKDINHNLQFIKEFDFNYNYLVSPTVTYSTTPSDYSTSDEDPYQRLMLSSLTEKGLNSTNPPYQFIYNDDIRLPNRFSNSQDLWGFFNNNTCGSLIPTIYVYPNLLGQYRFSPFQIPNYNSTFFTFPGADRGSNLSASLSGTLTKIIYPTGGDLTLQYELNKFYDPAYWGDITGGGLRLKKSILYDGIDHVNDISKEYTYNLSSNPSHSSGSLFNLPVYAHVINFPNYWDGGSGGILGVKNPEFDPLTVDYYSHNMEITSAPNYTLSGYDGLNIGYSEITEHISGKGYILKRYSTPGRIYDNNDAIPQCNTSDCGYCDGLYTTPITKFYNAFFVCLNYNNTGTYDFSISPNLIGIPQDNFYPYVPRTNYDWNRGLLLNEKDYDENWTLLKEIVNNYDLYTPMNQGPKYVYGLRKVKIYNQRDYLGDCGSSPYPHKFFVASRYPVITQVTKVISSTTTKTYDQNLGVNYVTNSTNYTYALNEKMVNKVESNLSNGDVTDKFLLYPLDYSLNGTSSDPTFLGLKNLQDKHVISPIIETYTQVKSSNGTNSRIVAGQFTTFKSDWALPDKVYNLEINQPLTTFTPTSISATGTTKDIHYQQVISCDHYDIAGNLYQFTKRGENPSAILYGYNKTLPIAKVTNSEVGAVAYTSFEEDDAYSSNWILHTTPIQASNAITGENCYDLHSSVNNNYPISPGTYILTFWADNTNPSVYSINISQAGASGTPTVTLINHTNPTVAGNLGYYEYKIDNPFQFGNISLSSSVSPTYCDELRLYPINASINTYTYKKMIGLTSSCDEKNQVTKYEYDDLCRLKLIRDKDGNIIKKVSYGIQQPE